MADEHQEVQQPGPDRGRLAAGIAIIVFGVLLALDRADVIDWGRRSGWWPLLAIVFGVMRLATCRDGIRSGTMFIAIGAWGLLNEYGVLQYNQSWPLLLVIVGGSMVLGALVPPRPVRSDGLMTREARRGDGSSLIWLLIVFGIVMSLQGRVGPFDSRLSRLGRATGSRVFDRRGQGLNQSDTGDTVHRAIVLGSSHSVSHATQFHGGELTAIMGECELDLTQATVAPGETPVLEIFVLMGDMTLRVPDSWIVDTGAVPAMGEVKDTRISQVRQDASRATPEEEASRPHLVLRGSVTMGDLRIKD